MAKRHKRDIAKLRQFEVMAGQVSSMAVDPLDRRDGRDLLLTGSHWTCDGDRGPRSGWPT